MKIGDKSNIWFHLKVIKTKNINPTSPNQINLSVDRIFLSTLDLTKWNDAFQIVTL